MSTGTYSEAAMFKRAGLCTVLHLQMTTRLVVNHYQDAVKKHGLGIRQFNALVTLMGMGPLSITEMAKTLALERTALTRNLRVLEKDGLIASEKAEAGNVRFVRITEAGRAKVDEAFGDWLSYQTDLKDKLGNEDWKELIRLLGRVREVL